MTVSIGALTATASFGTVIVAGTTYANMLKFDTVAGQNAYTVADVSGLSSMATKTMYLVTMDGSIITNLSTWDNTTFTINAGVTVSGGERIVILFQ